MGDVITKSPLEILKEKITVDMKSEDEILEATFLLSTSDDEAMRIAGGALMWAMGIEFDGLPNPIGEEIDALMSGEEQPLVQVYDEGDLKRLEEE